jgi:hypothetical protein
VVDWVKGSGVSPVHEPHLRLLFPCSYCNGADPMGTAVSLGRKGEEDKADPRSLGPEMRGDVRERERDETRQAKHGIREN